MSELAEMIKKRKPDDLSYAVMANQISIAFSDVTGKNDPEMFLRPSTLHRYLNGSRDMDVRGIRYISAWASKNKDQELLDALVSYSTGLTLKVVSSG